MVRLREARTVLRMPGRAGVFRPAGAAGEGMEAARRRAVAWAGEVCRDDRVVFLDTETTGLGAGAEVVDVGVVAGDGRVLLETLVRPSGPIPPEASAIHGIRDDDVRGAPTWPAVHGVLAGLLRGRRVVVYNAAFDRRILGQSCDRHDLALPGAAWECAMRAYAEFHGEWNPHRGSFRLQKLEVAIGRFGGQPGGHRAAADARACRGVVLGMAAGGA